MEISRFRELLGRAPVGGDVEHDWRPTEDSSGLTFPEDYKWFVTAYGPGCINDQLYIFHPRAADEGRGLRLASLWEQAASAYAELRQNNPDQYPYIVDPGRGGLIPVARSTSGNLVFLCPPKNDVANWAVVLDMGQWVHLEMSFTEFLWAALQGELEAPIVDGEPIFESVGAMES